MRIRSLIEEALRDTFSTTSCCVRRVCVSPWERRSCSVGFWVSFITQASRRTKNLCAWRWKQLHLIIAMRRAFSVFRGYRKPGEDDDDVFVCSRPRCKVKQTYTRQVEFVGYHFLSSRKNKSPVFFYFLIFSFSQKTFFQLWQSLQPFVLWWIISQGTFIASL